LARVLKKIPVSSKGQEKVERAERVTGKDRKNGSLLIPLISLIVALKAIKALKALKKTLDHNKKNAKNEMNARHTRKRPLQFT